MGRAPPAPRGRLTDTLQRAHEGSTGAAFGPTCVGSSPYARCVGNERADPPAGPEPLSPEDATLSCATAPGTRLQIGALCRFEGGPLRDAAGRLRREELREHVASRLHLMPRFRQRIQRVPFDLARPVWVDDTDFDLDGHLLDATLPPPGGTAELRQFVGELLGRPLDAAHPLWDLWLVDGLAGGDVVVVLRADHVLADGLSLLRAAMALLDLEPDPPAVQPATPWLAREPPGPATLAARGLLDRGRHQVGLAAGAARSLLDPRRALQLTRSVVTVATSPPPLAPGFPLTGRIGGRRDFVWASLPLEPLHSFAHTHGATLNDGVLALVTLALRRVLGTAAADALAGKQPKVLVPIGDTAGGDGGNVFSFVVTELPVHLDDPALVVDRVHEAMQDRKASRQSTDLLALFSVVDVVPIALLRRLGPTVLARQPLVNLAVTNVPGSPVPLYLRGAELQEMHPIVCGVGNLACIIGVLSYRDHLHVGITVDPDVVAEADELADALVDVSRQLAG